MKLWKLFISLFLSASLAHAGADCLGPGCGGTNLYEDELVDFVKFKDDYGDLTYPINPEKFHVRGEKTPALSQVRATLDRLAYHYPGSDAQLNDTFKKPWLVVNKEFTSRNTGEKKVVSQTEDGVFLNLQWVKKVDQKQLQQVFVHEAVRNWATHLVKDAVNSIYACDFQTSQSNEVRDRLTKKYADKFTEALTPLVFKNLQFRLIQKTANNLMKEMENEIAAEESSEMAAFRKENPKSECTGPNGLNRPFELYSREDLYSELRGTDPQKILDRVCKPFAQSKTNIASDENEKLAYGIIDEITTNAPNQYIKSDYNNRQCPTGIMSDNSNVLGMVTMVRYLGYLAMPTKGCGNWTYQNGGHLVNARETANFGIRGACSWMNLQKAQDIASQWKKDGGQVHDPLDANLLDEIPDDLPVKTPPVEAK